MTEPLLVEVPVAVTADPGVITSPLTLVAVTYRPGDPLYRLGLAAVEALTTLVPQQVRCALIDGPDPDGTETWQITAPAGEASTGRATGDLRVTAVLDRAVAAAIRAALTA